MKHETHERSRTLTRLHAISDCGNDARKADVVFLHGLGGDAFATWRHGKDESTSWPHWMATEFSGVGIWSVGYAASPTRWTKFCRLIGSGSRDSGHSMALPDRALQVLDLMTQNGLGKCPILFICHSLGGLLAKQVLRKASDATDSRKQEIARQTRAVLFLATPHTGATLASLIDGFRTVFGATVSIEDLREHDAHLRDLFDWYRNRAPQLDIRTVTYFETRRVSGVLPIVNPTSAHPGVGEDPVGLDEDHLSIAKPREANAQVCGAARNLLLHFVLDSRLIGRTSTPGLGPIAPTTSSHELVIKLEPGTFASRDERPVPRELPPSAYKFFGRDAQRKQLAERLRSGLNTAVVGPAGFGKTALAANALTEVTGVNAIDLAASPFPDGLVFLDLYSLHGQAESAWNALANRLRGVQFMERSSARERATEACRGRQVLVIIEGGEEADGGHGRSTISELLSVLSPENRWLLLTRVSIQTAVAESVQLKEALDVVDAGDLLDSLTVNRTLAPTVRHAVLELLEGHPLALTWAGNLLARDDEEPARLAEEWNSQGLPRLSDPREAEHTLRWLFERSVRGLDNTAQQALAAAGLLAHAPFSIEAIQAACDAADASHDATHDDGTQSREALRHLVQRGLLRRAEDDHWQFTHALGYRFARDENGSKSGLRQRLGHWLHGHLVTALAASDGAEATTSLAPFLEHAAALLRADYDQQLWDPLARALLYEVSDRMEDVGRLDLTSLALGAVADWLARFPERKAEDAYWLGQRCVLLVDHGDVLRVQGDLAGALAAYRESLAVSQRLAAADPFNAGWQRDLSVSQERIGDVLRAQGDLAGALAACRESLAVSHRLAAMDPFNAGWQRDLSVSQGKIGDVLRAQGDLTGALAAHRESLEVSQRLAAADPSNAEWQRDLSVSQERVGSVLRAQGDLAGALAAYRESLAVSQRLAAADPSNAVWQRDLSVSQGNIGDVLRAQGDLAGALAAHREALAVRQRLTAADPSNAGWQRDLSVVQERIGSVLRAQGDLAGALAAYRESLAVSQRLAAADPSNAEWQRDLSLSLTLMAEILKQQGVTSEALRLAEESVQIDERLAALDRTNIVWQEDVAVSRALVARLRRGDE